jgi:hypothetical protein
VSSNVVDNDSRKKLIEITVKLVMIITLSERINNSNKMSVLLTFFIYITIPIALLPSRVSCRQPTLVPLCRLT